MERPEARHPLAKACDQCHRCKIACDGQRPICDRCTTNNSVCTYSTGKPIGKPKGSKNRSKSDAQRTATTKVDTSTSSPPVASESSKRKAITGRSPGAHQSGVRMPQNHKRQRSSVYLSSPTSLRGFVGEPELSSGTSTSSAHPLEQIDLQAEQTASAPTPEFLRLMISPSQDPEVELDSSFNQDIHSPQDWFSNIVNDAQQKTINDSFFSTFEQQSLTPQPLPPTDSSLVSNEIGTIKTTFESQKENSQADHRCTCTAESLSLIPELQQYSTGRSNLTVNETLRLTRQATSTISNHLDCPFYTKTNSSQTSLLACILVLMQVTACYSSLRKSLEDPENQDKLPVSFGGLPIEEDETRRHILNVVMDAEIGKAATVNARLEDWGRQLETASDALPWKPLLLSVRQELDRL